MATVYEGVQIWICPHNAWFSTCPAMSDLVAVSELSYLLPALAPIIRRLPISVYASAYRFGAQATVGDGDAVLYVHKCSPVSDRLISSPLPDVGQ